MQRTLPGLLRQAQTDFADARYTEIGVFSEVWLAKDARSFPSVSPDLNPRDFKRLADGPLRATNSTATTVFRSTRTHPQRMSAACQVAGKS